MSGSMNMNFIINYLIKFIIKILDTATKEYSFTWQILKLKYYL